MRWIEDALDLSAVDVEFSGYRSLAAAVRVPGSHGLFQRRGSRRRGRFGLAHCWQ